MTRQPPPTPRGVLLDLSGTLHVGETLVTGAVGAVARLRRHVPRLLFLTNTSTRSSTGLLAQLHTLGLTDVRRDELLTSLIATRRYLKQKKLRPLCLLEDTSDLEENSGEEADSGIDLTPPHNAVVVGLAPSNFHYSQLNEAFRILLKYPQGLIAVHRGNYLRDADGDLSLGPGAFVTALETASDCEPATVMGKPTQAFFESALMTWRNYGQKIAIDNDDDESEPLSPDQVAMIGDDVFADLQGAADAGIGIRILVQTGKYQEGDENKVANGVVTAVVPSIVEAVEYLFGPQ